MSIISPTATPRTSVTARTLVERYPLVAYFAIAFAGTWLTILPLLLGQDGLGIFAYRFGDAGILFALLSTFTGPLLAAYLVTALTSGRAGVRALRQRYAQWRVGAHWYGIALFGYLLIWLAGYSIWLDGAPLLALAAKPGLILSAYLAPLALLLILAFAEETGWRGFALPRLQERYGPLGGTILLALLHGLWHIPALLVPGFVSGSSFSLPFIVGWIATVMAATFLYSWIFNNTGGSLLIAILVHAGANASSSLLSTLVPDDPALSGWKATIYHSSWNLANLIPFAIAAGLIVVFTKGQLGYRPEHAPQLVDSSRDKARR
jgi:membrane protease YdiL (CAAX protease family)